MATLIRNLGDSVGSDCHSDEREDVYLLGRNPVWSDGSRQIFSEDFTVSIFRIKNKLDTALLVPSDKVSSAVTP
jgi:hypothetical protein